MEIKELVEKAFTASTLKGWHDVHQSDLDFAALVHSEISEFVEEIRNARGPHYFIDEQGREVRANSPHVNDFTKAFAQETFLESDRFIFKPEGRLFELADAVIRIADYCGKHGYDLQTAIKTKMAYNETRPYRHGGKLA